MGSIRVVSQGDRLSKPAFVYPSRRPADPWLQLRAAMSSASPRPGGKMARRDTLSSLRLEHRIWAHARVGACAPGRMR
eukprot:5750589-Pleurochrysis_carterae.AAC.1